MKLTPYLFFDGNCKEALEFYAEALGGEIIALLKFSEAPPEEECSSAMKDMVMHAQLKVGDQLLMASDAPKNYCAPQGLSISIGVDTPEEAERVYAALAEGGSVQMPMEETFWAKRFGVLSDRYGIPWMINCDR